MESLKVIDILNRLIKSKFHNELIEDLTHAVERNGEELFILMQKHNLPNNLFRDLLKFDLSTELKDKIKSLLKKRSLKLFSQLNEIKSISDEFTTRSIDHLFIKGVTYSKIFYNDITERESADIDVLVDVTQIEQADKYIKGEGYVRIFPDFELTKKQFKTFKRIDKHFTYYHPEKKVGLEFHWNLFRKAYMDFNWKNPEGHTGFNITNEFSIKTLSIDYAVLHMFAHGNIHLWKRLKWLMDAAMFVSKFKDYDWSNVIKLAKKNKMQNTIAEGLNLMNKLWDVEIPIAYLHLIEANKKVEKMTNVCLGVIEQGIEEYFGKSQWGRYHRKYYNFLVKDDWKYRLSGIVNFQSTEINDWKTLKINDKFFFLYYLLRPFFIIRTKILFQLNKKSK